MCGNEKDNSCYIFCYNRVTNSENVTVKSYIVTYM
nr:MAG TPA: hypothetical protein [Caudoviricetes sp.]